MIIQKADKKSLRKINHDPKNIHVDLKFLNRQLSFCEHPLKNSEVLLAESTSGLVRHLSIQNSSGIKLSGSQQPIKLIHHQDPTQRETSEHSKSSGFESEGVPATPVAQSQLPLQGSMTSRPDKKTTPRSEATPQSARGRIEGHGQTNLWFGPSTNKAKATNARRSSISRAKGGYRTPTSIVLNTDSFTNSPFAHPSRPHSHRKLATPRPDPDVVAFGSRTRQHPPMSSRSAASWSLLLAASAAPSGSLHPEAAANPPAAMAGLLTTRPLQPGPQPRGPRPGLPAPRPRAGNGGPGAEALQDRLVPDSASFLQSQAVRRLVDLADPSNPEHDTLYARFLLEGAGRARAEELGLIPLLLELRVLARGGTALNRRLPAFTYDGSLPVTDGLLSRCQCPALVAESPSPWQQYRPSRRHVRTEPAQPPSCLHGAAHPPTNRCFGRDLAKANCR